MAGIITDVSSDIQKLQQLKAEIESVKKALKGINVKVDIDIAKGMEAQLRSLVKQYDALVAKVSEAEGKIMLSTQRINLASEKIIKAQEQLSKAAGINNSQPNSGKANTAANSAEIVSVQAQAKSYDELAHEIDSVMGTRTQNIKRMIEEQRAIRLINEEIKKLAKFQTSNSTLTGSQQKRLEQLNNSLLTHKAALAEVRQTLMNNVKLDNAAATSMNGLSQSLSRMRIAYRELTEEERKSPFGQELLASIKQADSKIKELDASIGNHQRNVGNYASGFNGLSMSVQQIVRELPAATMGLNMFFLAISNNLPILTDEIKRAKAANEELKASGQKGVPVWKQVVSSLFSWQSALMVGITLLTMHGDKIWEWVSGLFGADKAQKNLTDSLVDFNSILGKSEAEANALFDAVKRTKEGSEGRAEAIRAINKAYGEYLPNLLSESSSLKELGDAYDIVNGKLRENAALKAQTNAVNKVMDEAIKTQADALTEMTRISERSVGAGSSNQIMEIVRGLTEDFRLSGTSVEKAWQGVSAKLQDMLGARALPGDFYEALNDYVKSVFDSNEEIENIQKRYNPFFNKKEADKAIIENKEYWEEVKRQAESVIASINSEDLLKLKDGNTSGIEKDIVDAYSNAMSNIQKAEKALAAYDFNKKGGKKTKANYDLFINVQDAYVYLISPEEIEKNIAMHREAMDRYLTEYGDYQQKRLAIADMYALKISQAETEGEKLSLRKQSEEALKTLDFEEFKKSINFADIFSDLDTQTTTSLRALRDKLGDYINEAAKDLRPEDLKELQDAFNNLDFKIADRSPFNELKSGLLEYKSAQEAVVKAQEGLNTVIAGGIVTVSEYDKATGELVSKTITQADAERNLAKALSERQGALAKLTKAANSIGAQGSEVVNAGNEIVDMLQSFGVEIPEAVSSTLEGVGQVMDGLASIDLTKPFSAITGTISVLTGIGKTIGGIFGFGGADYSEYDNMVERYSGLIDIWDELIDKKKEYIDISYGSESIKAANEALDILKKQEEVARTLAMERLSSGASIGSHSINYRMWQGSYKYDGKNWRDVAGEIERDYGVTFNGMADLLNMAPDVLQSIKDNYSGLWSVMDGDFRGYLENLIEYGDEAEGIADQLRESMAGISFDEFQNSFVDMLSDLDSTNQDFADDFEGYLQKAIFSSLVANQYKSRIKKLYDTWASYGESGSALTSDEVQSLRNEYQSIVNDMLEQRDQIMKDFGWESSASSSGQSASSRGFGTEMTHEDAGELSGRFTAVYESNLRIEAAEQQQTIAITELRGSISALSSQTTGIYNIADETRTILANSYLELQQIRENTGEIVKPIKQMQADIAEVKRNTSRL